MVGDRVGQARIEGETPNPQARLFAVMFGEGDRHLWLLGKSELDSVEWRRPFGYDRVLETQLAKDRPSARHQPFTARLVARKNLLVENDHATATSRGEKRCGGPGRPGANDRDVGVGGHYSMSGSSPRRRRHAPSSMKARKARSTGPNRLSRA